MKRTRLRLTLAAAAVSLLLGSCNYEGELPGREESPYPDFAAAGEAYPGPGRQAYFNPNSGCLLCTEADGSFSLATAEGRAEGTYSATEEELILRCGGEELRAGQSSRGLILSGTAGIFLPLEERESFSALGLRTLFDREYSDSGEGLRRLSDYGLGVGLIYPGEMRAPENVIPDAVVIWDGGEGYVTGRNVTEEFSPEGGEDFMEDYMRLRVPEDIYLIHGLDGEYESLELLEEGIDGRIASAEGSLAAGDKRIYVKAILYTSTYPDGTVNYICKCFFAPEGDLKTFNALANGVTEMSAVRRK